MTNLLYHPIAARRATSTLLFFITLTSLWGCGNRSRTKDEAGAYSPEKDYFPVKAKVGYAKGFTLEYFKHYKVVKLVNLFSNKKDTTYYVLLQKGTPAPSITNVHIIHIPVKNMICLSSTHVALTDFLNANEVISGLGDTTYLFNPEVQKLAKAGKIVQVGKSQVLNNEQILALAPEVIMTSGSPNPNTNTYQPFINAGINILPNSEWMENSLLGRAEWVKLMGALLNKDSLAEKKFKEIAQKYESVSTIAQNAKVKPKVISGKTFKGEWAIPGGNSYAANLLRDAGANYHWASDTTRGSILLNFEAVYPEAAVADFWLNPGINKTIKSMLDEDERYKTFKSLKDGHVYNNTRRSNDTHGNDYWESGIMNPHLILCDLVKILHPELLPNYELYYYQRLE